MPTDARVDRYIASAPAFAKPILEHVRDLIHKGCPDVEEDMKWSRPAFVYRGKMLGGMAAFKSHCMVGFWHGPVNKMIVADGFHGKNASVPLGEIATLDDLPPKPRFIAYVREACRLTEERKSNPAPVKRKSAPKPEAKVPPDFAAALKKDKRAAKAFESFSPSHRREYIEWITGAKRDETRQKRIAKAIATLAEAKSLNWKYQ